MFGLGVLSAAADRPQRRLLAVASPISLLANRVPARLTLPVIVALAHHQPPLCPNDLRSNCESALGETFRDDGRAKRPMPDIGDLTREEVPGRRPVGNLVVLDFALPHRVVDTPAMTPFRVV